MTSPVFIALAVLAVGPALLAQCPAPCLAGEYPGHFGDLNICQLVDAADALRGPAAAPSTIDASLCGIDTLLYCELNPLSPGDRFCPRQIPGEDPARQPIPVTLEEEARLPAPPRPDFIVACASTAPGGVILAGLPAGINQLPAPVEQVPEPSALLLLAGAAAWILLRRKL